MKDTRAMRVLATVFHKHKYMTNPVVTPEYIIIYTADKLAAKFKDRMANQLSKTASDQLEQLGSILKQGWTHNGIWQQIKLVPRFTYLGRVMTVGDDDWPAVAGNLAKARKSWGRMQGVLRREGATPQISRNVFKEVIQQVLLFGVETWVVTPKMERALSAFLHGAARRLTGREARRKKYGEWHYPSLEGP